MIRHSSFPQVVIEAEGKSKPTSRGEWEKFYEGMRFANILYDSFLSDL